jgi:hypothetical protein
MGVDVAFRLGTAARLLTCRSYPDPSVSCEN